jgi:asparaginyl-tRNA synthetase
MTTFFRIADVFRTQPIGAPIEIKGWLKTRRDAKGLSFLAVNDGSCLRDLQVIAEDGLYNYRTEIKKLSTGCSLQITGSLVQSPAQGQPVELRAEQVTVLGLADPASYPLQKKRHSFEFLRSIAHLRPRTNSLGAATRIRSRLSYAIHTFFQERGYYYIHTPIITTSDCEGAGEMFTVTAMDLEQVPWADGRPDYSRDFFGRPAGLTVSGQLEAEAYALALGKVYTFGPTFRAENSNTSRHLAEFWMVEPEIAFCDLAGDIDIAEDFLKYCIRDLLTVCREDLELFDRFVDTSLFARLDSVLEYDFMRISYGEAVERLQAAERNFEYDVAWGSDLQSEHERYLTEEVFMRPTVVIDYPKTIKPFYMRENDDGRTVAAMDILFPGIGEIIGGSQREERLEVLKTRMAAANIAAEEYEWYLDLRRFGSVEHAGFGLGLERLVQFVTGLPNIREVIPFPRTPGSADF